MKIDLSLKIRMAFLILSLLVVLLITVTSIVNREVLLETVGVQTISLAEEMLDRIDSNIFFRIEQIELYFKNISLITYDLKRISEELIVFFNNKYADIFIHEILLLSRVGFVITRVGSGLEYPVDYEVALQGAIENGVYMGDVYYSDIHNKPVIPICIKIESMQQEFYIYLEMSALEIFRDIQEWYSQKFNIQTKLTTREGKLLYATGVYRFFEDLSDTALFNAATKGQGFLIVNENQKEKLFSFSQSGGYRGGEGTEWYLFIGYDIVEVLEAELKNNMFFHALGILLLLTILVTGFILSRQITIPMRKLVEGTMRLKNGDFAVSINVKSNDEFGDLADKFNTMSHQLKSYYTKLIGEIDKRKIVERELKNTILSLNTTNRELEQFAYVASHDLQEPLRSIAGFLQLFERQYQAGIDKKGREYIDRSVNAAKRLQGIINGLLYYSRIKPDFTNLVVCDLNVVLDNLLVEYQAELDPLGGRIIYYDLPGLKMNEDHLKEVFNIIIGNAIKYYRDDVPLEIIIEVKRFNSMWKVLVQDNGIGIESDYFDKIFELFQRLHSRKKYEGNGLGLAICKKIINLYGGDIWVESEPDKGAAFYFTLPQAPLEDIYG